MPTPAGVTDGIDLLPKARIGSATLPDRPLGSRTLDLPSRGLPFRYDVAIVGLGYVGLPTALAFHAAGHRVLGLELSERRVTDIMAGDVDLLDSDHARLATALEDRGRFEMTIEPSRLAEAAGVLVCVPTPVDEHLMPDLRALTGACRTLVNHAVPGQTLLLTSTTYVGCTRELLASPLASRGLAAGRDVFVSFSPERIDPGNDRHAHEDVPRVVGGITPACADAAEALLAGYAGALHRVSSAETAEMTKLYENTFRAVNIALANELADISRVLDLDVTEVIDAAATKPYGFMPFYPGPGVGGHCIPCDPHYLLWQLRRERANAPLIESAMSAVALRPGRVVSRAGEVLAAVGRPLSGSRVLVLGVTYKPGVADVRESPALEILADLADHGAEVAYHDPLIPRLRVGGQEMHNVADPAAEQWDLVLVHTEQPGANTSWLAAAPLVLDATYKLSSLRPRTVV
jgi:UDP-N-acetyl-D-glucosamine dehydrogenase